MLCLDFQEHQCPYPLLESKLWLKRAQIGDQIQLLLGDSGSRSDIPKYFRRLGHAVTIEQSEHRFSVTITVQPLKD
ncbi:sulfurtransferase TusA family protein [Agarivorans sp. 1_MG-2023]|uniref:sulfurtransferase TusA family protein n=1 Tax=Agarivorans sp. 1_MG-2023 TaxID=3062634 RepID=UPI0026E16B87|nr:sulfurtransferase TusA family protein [Agarivorans sp. 1_MG-2023]MDO6766007.1 sulfurtransferase TusA family protein [Agarivorans sp. 1_MG-2023]